MDTGVLRAAIWGDIYYSIRDVSYKINKNGDSGVFVIVMSGLGPHPDAIDVLRSDNGNVFKSKEEAKKACQKHFEGIFASFNPYVSENANEIYR